MSRLERLRQMLQEDSQDGFLRYALALELVKTGSTSEGLSALDALIADDPKYVAAYFQKAQILAEQGETASAREACTAGITAARLVGDAHAAGEMMGFLESLEE
ncbi:MAG: hypothetical protein C0478_07790 [Planctomyces sp.]|nr:hypothetical protein [Planctomyces sp.]